MVRPVVCWKTNWVFGLVSYCLSLSNCQSLSVSLPRGVDRGAHCYIHYVVVSGPCCISAAISLAISAMAIFSLLFHSQQLLEI